MFMQENIIQNKRRRKLRLERHRVVEFRAKFLSSQILFEWNRKLKRKKNGYLAALL